MKTLNTAVVSFAAANTTITPTIQEYFNGMLEGLSSQEILVGGYYNSLTHVGKGLFDRLFESVSEGVVSISKAIKTRSVKLRKQISAVAKRHSKSKVQRADKGLFTISKEALFSKMEFEASLLLRRVGIIPTDSPILELMSIPVTEAGFLFSTEELCNSLRGVLAMAAKVLAV
jgi:hypothetical protein